MRIKISQSSSFIGLSFLLFLLFLYIPLFVGCNDERMNAVDTPPCTITYIASNGGKLLIGKDPNVKERYLVSIFYDKYGITVKAVPDKGYYFVKWADGNTDAERVDKGGVLDLQIVAEFAEIDEPISITYKTLGMGFIKGESEQIIQRGTDAQPVEASIYGGDDCVFIRWSDGLKDDVRQDKSVMESIEVTAMFGCKVNYAVNGNGTIVGKPSQTVVYGENAETVTAMPDKGYRFVKWSDGVKSATRQDKVLGQPINVCALFEWRNTDTFSYHYNYATGNYFEEGLTLTRGEVNDQTAIVPERDYFDFGGWYFDEKCTQKAFDVNGNNLLGEDIFNSPSRDLYAKWDVKSEYVTTYKILMVYVTKINGKFVGNDGQCLEVDYNMSQELRSQCVELTKRFNDMLNNMLDGLVNFEINSYFTTKSVDESCFKNEINDTCIFANQIPELNNSKFLDNYRSVITIYSFGGEENLLVNWAGTAGKKYATIPIDKVIRFYGNIYDALYEYDSLIGTCVHEFIHTIERGIACFDYHKAYNPYIPRNISDKLYLLNQFPSDYYKKLAEFPDLWEVESFVETWRYSDKVGIPYGYWANEIFDVTIKPECINGFNDDDSGGYVFFTNNDSTESDLWRMQEWDIYSVQKVPHESRTTMFYATPKKGYRFVGWSDGTKDELRIITNVCEDMTVTAYFERLPFTVEYKSSEGGRIEGETDQTLLVGEKTKEVVAVADEGYRFVGWSDGRENNSRYDYIGQNVYDENGELYYRLGFTVIAIFEKIEE